MISVINLTERKEKQDIAGRLPENSRNRFVDRQSQKKQYKDRPKKLSSLNLLYFD